MLDSNILISIAIFNSEQLGNLLENICQNHQLVISSTIIDEINNVMERKFPDKQYAMEKFLYKIPYEYVYISDNMINKQKIKIRDPNDIPILYSAIITNVDIFITGDKDFETLDIERPEILKPLEFLNKY